MCICFLIYQRDTGGWVAESTTTWWSIKAYGYSQTDCIENAYDHLEDKLQGTGMENDNLYVEFLHSKKII